MPSMQTCGYCKKEFLYPRRVARNGNAYCSKDCFQLKRYGRKSDGEMELECSRCGKPFKRWNRYANPSKRTFCSQDCFYSTNSREGHGQWTGGRFIDVNGYVAINTGSGRRHEHLIIAEKALGRKLKRGEVVHHVNGIKDDNRNENLLICDISYHAWLHQKMSRLYQSERFGGSFVNSATQ